MGCGGSSFYEDYPDLEPYKPLFMSLQLTSSDVKALYHTFVKIDKDRSGSINVQELLNFLDLEPTPYNKRIFSCFDENSSGSVDFREYVIALWNYLTCGTATLDMFTFDLYDRDNSGFITYEEIESICKEIFGEKWNGNKSARSVIAQMKKKQGELGLDLEGFQKFARTHQLLFKPTFEIQSIMRQKICGNSFWNNLSHKRIRLAKNFVIPIKDFKELMNDPEKFNTVITQLGGNMSLRGANAIMNTGTMAMRSQSDMEGPEYSDSRIHASG